MPGDDNEKQQLAMMAASTIGNPGSSGAPAAPAPAAAQQGSTGPVDNSLPSYLPEWMKRMQPMQLPQGAPGQLQMLAQDLAAGGYGNPKANLAWMDQFYNPVDTFKQGLVPKETDKPKAAPSEKSTLPYMVHTQSPMSGGHMTEWWKTGLVNDPRWIKQFGNTRKPPNGY